MMKRYKPLRILSLVAVVLMAVSGHAAIIGQETMVGLTLNDGLAGDGQPLEVFATHSTPSLNTQEAVVMPVKDQAVSQTVAE